MADVPKFSDGDVFKAFAAAVQLLVDLDGGFLHDRVRIMRSAQKREVIATSYPFMSVFGIKGQPKQGGLSLWF